MNKIVFYLLGVFSGILLPSLYAWKLTDEANMTKPTVQVIQEYEGEFRGWDNHNGACLDCKEVVPTNENRVLLSSTNNNPRTYNASVKKSIEQWKPYRTGYCECNCQ